MNLRTSLFVLVALAACNGNNRPGTIGNLNADVPYGFDLIDGTLVPFDRPEGGSLDRGGDATGDRETMDSGALPDGETPEGGGDAGGDTATADLPDGACSLDLATDPRHCGRCGNDCTALPGVDPARARCADGRCVVSDACAPGRADCDTMAATGCEASLSAAETCGACTVRCASPTPMCSAMTTDAGMSFGCTRGCMEPTTDVCGDSCVNLRTDTTHCGRCGNACPMGTNAITTCAMGACGYMCGSGFSDCDMDRTPGCETATGTDVRNCGRCGNACPTATNAMASCAMGMCRIACNMGFGDCDMMAANGCEQDLASDPDNCGACRNPCRVTNGTAVCMMGTCDITCDPGFYREGNMCLPVPPPRLTRPVSGTLVTSRRPTFRWERGSATESVVLEICRDRGCGTIAATIEADGNFVTPSADLPAGVLFWRGRGRNRGSTGRTSSAVWEFRVPARSAAANNVWGNFVDVNGDGYTDLLVGARDAAGAFVYAGSMGAGLGTVALATLSSAASMGFGRAVTGAGDVNGDGYTDFLVGAPGAGRVLAYHGGSMGLGMTPATMSAALTGAGGAIAFAGDLNRDGYGDVLSGVPGANIVQVFTGSMAGLGSSGVGLTAPMGATGYGRLVAGAGDTNDDGLDDVLVGADGAVFLHVGVLGMGVGGSMILSATPARIGPPSGAMGFAASAASAGDLNGDGVLDVAVGAPGSAQVFVYHGARAGIATTPSVTLAGPPASSFGVAVLSAGDTNGDGYGDLLVGARGAAIAYLYLGGPRGVPTEAALSLAAPSGVDPASVVLASAGDVNGDGRDDVALGDPSANRVVVFHATVDGFASMPSTTLTSSAGSGFGSALFGAWR
ncbi:MAG: FG-GAP repeat protein [Deltaproteobacteria bacterium]|nr:FG-GAP repeat protein [Deltaproteobacteria bacterium]